MVAVPTLQSILEQGLVSRIAGRQDAPLAACCPTGIGPVDEAMPGGGLGLGMTHEWILEGCPEDGWGWRAPLILMTFLAGRATRAGEGGRVGRGGAGGGGLMVAIGRRCWPSLWTLRRIGLDLNHCILAD